MEPPPLGGIAAAFYDDDGDTINTAELTDDEAVQDDTSQTTHQKDGEILQHDVIKQTVSNRTWDSNVIPRYC